MTTLATLQNLRTFTFDLGDIHIRNERGDWTIVEKEDALTIRNNKTGKVYIIMMTERKV